MVNSSETQKKWLTKFKTKIFLPPFEFKVAGEVLIALKLNLDVIEVMFLDCKS
jgi:hypothetical protein